MDKNTNSTEKHQITIIGTKDYTVPMFGNRRSEPYGKLVLSVDGEEMIAPIQNGNDGAYIVIDGIRFPVANYGGLYSPRFEFVVNEVSILCSCCGNRETFNYVPDQINAVLDKGWGSYGRALYCPECSRTWHERNTKEMATRKHTSFLIWEIYRNLHRSTNR